MKQENKFLMHSLLDFLSFYRFKNYQANAQCFHPSKLCSPEGIVLCFALKPLRDKCHWVIYFIVVSSTQINIQKMSRKSKALC